MREIKFRGRDEHGEWHYGAFMGVFYDGVVAPIEYANIYDDGMATRVLPDTVGQFTGLKDATGKEIYEGDIVEAKLKDKSFVKRFNMNETIVGGISFDGAWWIGEWDALWRLPRYYDLTVIGNVYDNPKPLELKDDADAD